MNVEAGKDVFPQLCSTLFFEIVSLMKPAKGQWKSKRSLANQA